MLFFAPVQVPGPAPNLQAVSNTPTSVSLSWDKPLTGNGEILSYKLYYTDRSIGTEEVRASTGCTQQSIQVSISFRMSFQTKQVILSIVKNHLIHLTSLTHQGNTQLLVGVVATNCFQKFFITTYYGFIFLCRHFGLHFS